MTTLHVVIHNAVGDDGMPSVVGAYSSVALAAKAVELVDNTSMHYVVVDAMPSEMLREPKGDPDYNPNRDQESYERAYEEKRRLS